MENIDQTNYEEQSFSQKLKTPAALFINSASKSPISRLRPQVSPSTQLSQNNSIQNCCQNHSNKQATFFTTTEGQKLYFCQKCAITLASQGHTIQKLNIMTNSSVSSPAPSNHSASRRKPTFSVQHSTNKRQEQMNKFLSELKDILNTVGQTKETIKQKLIQSEQFYGEQLQQVNDYFTLIIKSLELEKHKCYNHILNERQQAEQHIRGINQALVSVDQDINKILMDIQQNLQTVYSIEEQIYQTVFSKYLAQQRQFQQNISGLLLTPIQMRKIQFEGVPESIYNLSDIVIQNSMNNHQNQQYRLVDSLSVEDLNNIRAISPKKSKDNMYPNQQYSQADSLKFSFEAERLKGQSFQYSQQSAHHYPMRT